MVVEEAEKSHDLPSASRRPRKASGGVLVQPKGLGTRGATVVSFSLNLKAREPGPAESKSTLPLPFSCTGRPHFIVSHFIALHRGCVSLGFVGSKILKARLSTSKRIAALFIAILTL